jgi:hypothetical protein
MDENRKVTTLIIGGILIVVGILALLGQFFTSLNWDNLWPLIVIVVGAAFFVGMALGGKSAGGLAVPGSILVAVGLILLVINSTEQWVAWSYAWALIIFAVGVGVWINGLWSDRPELRRQGLDTMRAGLVLFLIFGIVMSFIFSVTGVTQSENILLWSVLLALLGLILLVWRILRLGTEQGQKADLFWPILMIGAGVLASLAALDRLPAENLWMVAQLWPLLLIVGGIGLLLRGRSPWVGAVLGVAVVAVMFAAAFAGQQIGLKPQPYMAFESMFSDINIDGGPRQQVTGSGKVITQDRTVSGFSRVSMEIPGSLEIQQGASEALSVTGQENVLAVLVTEVHGDTLSIRYQPRTEVRTTQALQLRLTVKDFTGLEVSSLGQVTVKPVKAHNFHLALSSTGSITMQQLQADKIDAELSSSGQITLKGSASQLDVQVSSSGPFQAGDLKVQQATVRLSSSGEVTVWVTDLLRVNISSSGNVSYYGSPTVDQSITSSGKVIPLGEK